MRATRFQLLRRLTQQRLNGEITQEEFERFIKDNFYKQLTLLEERFKEKEKEDERKNRF